MTINFAHLRDQGIDFVVFDADARSHQDADRRELLADLTMRARQNGLRIEKAALAYRNGSRIEYFGTPGLVGSRWTHSMSA